MGDEGPLTFWRTVGRGLRLRCPRCGGAGIFTGLFAMASSCPTCGLDVRREQGYYVGAMYINYGITATVELAFGIPLADRISLTALTIPLAAFGLLFPLFFFRYSKSLWLGIDLYLSSLAPK